MILKFDNSYTEREIGRPQSEQEARRIIQDFLEKHNYKSYYTRTWVQDGVKIFDVGSWTQFFKLYLEEI